MRICLHIDAVLPVALYGGTERVVWGLAKALARAGHDVTLMAGRGTVCDFARVVEADPSQSVWSQVPQDVDIVHFQYTCPPGEPVKPYVVTVHGNMSFPIPSGHEGEEPPFGWPVDPNSIFVSQNHARRHGAHAFVHNGLEWADYPAYKQDVDRSGLFFLGKAAWRVKNVRGAIRTARMAGERLDVLGGSRLNFKMGFRLTLDPNVRFHGMVDDRRKAEVANRSRGLIFPVRWDEPFGLAVTEALYYGASVFGTPYGSLPELVIPDVGALSADMRELAEAIRGFHINPSLCHEYARDVFNSDVMASKYVGYYGRILNGESINPGLVIPDKSPADYSGCSYE